MKMLGMLVTKTPGAAPAAAQTYPITSCHGQSGSRHRGTVSSRLLCCLLRNTLHSEMPARSRDLIKNIFVQSQEGEFPISCLFLHFLYCIFPSYSSVKTHAVERLRSSSYEVISKRCPAPPEEVVSC